MLEALVAERNHSCGGATPSSDLQGHDGDNSATCRQTSNGIAQIFDAIYSCSEENAMGVECAAVTRV